METPVKPKDLVEMMRAMNTQITMLRKRMAQHERDRLQLGYNKVPLEIKYLTVSEQELKKELVQCIEAGQDFLVSQE